MTELELRTLDAKVHEAFAGELIEWRNVVWSSGLPYVTGVSGVGVSEPIIGWRGDAAILVPHYTTDLAAAWTLDRPGWEWHFDELDGSFLTGHLYTQGDYQCISFDIEVDGGDKPRAYCLARVRCVLQALGVKV